MNGDQEHAMKDQLLEAYEAHADSVYRYGCYKLSDSEAARDLVQDTFLRYGDALRKKTRIENERAFVFTIARRLVIDRYRARKSESLDALEEMGFEPVDTTIAQPSDAAEGSLVRDALAQVPEPYREVILLRYFEGLEPREIAKVLGESANAVTVRIHRGLAKLRERFTQEDHD